MMVTPCYNARFIVIAKALTPYSRRGFLITEEGKLPIVDVCLSNQKL
jgi:hypothetical protein